MSDMHQHLFVYGTLAPGKPNAHVLSDLGGHWQRAYVLGYLHEQGWGATQGFPGIRLNEKGERIHGWLFSSRHLNAHWSRLDEFEGDDYRRVIVETHLHTGETRTAYIYQVAD